MKPWTRFQHVLQHAGEGFRFLIIISIFCCRHRNALVFFLQFGKEKSIYALFFIYWHETMLRTDVKAVQLYKKSHRFRIFPPDSNNLFLIALLLFPSSQLCENCFQIKTHIISSAIENKTLACRRYRLYLLTLNS